MGMVTLPPSLSPRVCFFSLSPLSIAAICEFHCPTPPPFFFFGGTSRCFWMGSAPTALLFALHSVNSVVIRQDGGDQGED